VQLRPLFVKPAWRGSGRNHGTLSATLRRLRSLRPAVGVEMRTWGVVAVRLASWQVQSLAASYRRMPG